MPTENNPCVEFTPVLHIGHGEGEHEDGEDGEILLP